MESWLVPLKLNSYNVFSTYGKLEADDLICLTLHLSTFTVSEQGWEFKGGLHDAFGHFYFVT